MLFRSFKKAIEKNQNYPDAYSNLGLMYRKQNLLDKSEINFEKAIRLNPNFFKAYENLMEMYEKTNQDNKLNALISDAEKIFTNNPIIDFYKSKILLTANAKLAVSSTVSTGTSLGICNVELILVNISTLSANGGIAKTGEFTLHATTPDNALLIPAIVI